jgi:DNA ligase (NAD+)
VDLDKRADDAEPYEFPTRCPRCNSHAVREENEKTGRKDAVRRCTGGLICPAQATEKLKHFVSRNAFDIEGFGDKQVDAFYQDDLVKTAADIFTLAERDKQSLTKLRNREGWGAVSAKNLFEAIDARREIDLHRFIFALGIRHVGEGNAKLLARAYGSWDGLLQSDDRRPAIMEVRLGPSSMTLMASGISLPMRWWNSLPKATIASS